MENHQRYGYLMHPSSTKINHNLGEVYLLNNMWMCIADFVTKCPNCERVNETPKAMWYGYKIAFPEWKWEMKIM